MPRMLCYTFHTFQQPEMVPRTTRNQELDGDVYCVTGETGTRTLLSGHLRVTPARNALYATLKRVLAVESERAI